jgi:SAM-dependent methyltransferase
MKTRESGMPDEERWSTFFDAPAILRKLGLSVDADGVVEFGCGYGTFTLPAARLCRGILHAFDIEPAMVERVRGKAEREGFTNIVCQVRDFISDGTGLLDGVADYAMLFNILHAECPEVLLREARRVLRPGGRLGIIHWRYDPSTPRGPSMSIRPRPEQLRAWAESEGFRDLAGDVIDLPPHHYGLLMGLVQ